MRILFDELLMKEIDLPTNYLDGLNRVCDEDKYAFMILDNMAALLQNEVDCKLEPLDVISHTTIAMILQPNSPYRGIINAKCVRVSLMRIKMIKHYFFYKDLRFLLQYSFAKGQRNHAAYVVHAMEPAKYSECVCKFCELSNRQTDISLVSDYRKHHRGNRSRSTI